MTDKLESEWVKNSDKLTSTAALIATNNRLNAEIKALHLELAEAKLQAGLGWARVDNSNRMNASLMEELSKYKCPKVQVVRKSSDVADFPAVINAREAVLLQLEQFNERIK